MPVIVNEAGFKTLPKRKDTEKTIERVSKAASPAEQSITDRRSGFMYEYEFWDLDSSA
jgi:hypothetical protein